MEVVAERNHGARRVMRDKPREPRQRLGRIVWRQQLTAAREARAFFEMEVGDDQQRLVAPAERAAAVCRERDAVDRDDVLGGLPGWRGEWNRDHVGTENRF